MQNIPRGTTHTFDAETKEGVNGPLVDGDPVLIDIVDPSNVEVVSNASPTTNPSTGRYTYDYTVGGAATLGIWFIRWVATINGVSVTGIEQFEVTEAGSIVFPPGPGPSHETCEAWALPTDIYGRCADIFFEEEEQLSALTAASHILYELSGRQFPGICTAIVRPCSRHKGGDYVPNRIVGNPLWRGTCGCSDVCGLSSRVRVGLEPGPVTSVSAVKIDGTLLTADQFALYERKYLVRLPDVDGTNPGFPCCQNLTLDTTEEGTFEVTFSYGKNPPEAGKRAAASLACELMLLTKTSSVKDCRLPQRVQNVTRQGISMVLIDPLDLFDQGKTGIPEVDLWLKAVNPGNLRQSAIVVTPETLKSGLRTDI